MNVKRPYIKILGTSAGGGLPQWNCFCKYCKLARNGSIPKRKQSSIALVNKKEYTLVNASPDISDQIIYFDQPDIRKNPMKNIILTDAQLDHTLGLLQIREGDSLSIFGTSIVHEQISSEFGIIPLLEKYCKVQFNTLNLEVPFSPIDDIEVTSINIISNSPPYSKYRDIITEGSNIGLLIKSDLKTVFYAPGLLNINYDIKSIISEIDHLLIDGTCWSSDELSFLNKPHLEDLGHISQTGLIKVLKGYTCKKTLIHINNTNPINDPRSKENKMLRDNGIDIAYDGMEIEL